MEPGLRHGLTMMIISRYFFHKRVELETQLQVSLSVFQDIHPKFWILLAPLVRLGSKHRTAILNCLRSKLIEQ